ENDERAKAAADCKEIARQLRVPVITPTQAATEVEKKTQQGKRASKLDVYGSKGQVHVSNTFMIITYKGTDDTQVDIPDYLRDVYWLCDGKKNRDGAPFYFMAKHMVKTGTVIEIDDPSKKPTQDEKKEIDKIEKDLVAAVDTVIEAKQTSAPVVPVEISPVPELNTGLRDASVEFAEEIEGNTEEDEAIPTSSLEDQAIKEALLETEKTEIEEENNIVIPAREIIERDRLARAAIGLGRGQAGVSSGKSLLSKIRSSQILPS
ncbi:MAG: hypothetical protein ABFD50_15525, partial [Smithella sp.]